MLDTACGARDQLIKLVKQREWNLWIVCHTFKLNAWGTQDFWHWKGHYISRMKIILAWIDVFSEKDFLWKTFPDETRFYFNTSLRALQNQT